MVNNRARVMAIVSGAAACLGAAALPSTGQDRLTTSDESTFSRTLRFAGADERTLVIRLVHGSIRVSGSDDQAVELTVRKRIRAENNDAVQQAEREVALDIADNAAIVGAIAREPDGGVCGEQNDNRRGWRMRPRYQVTFDVSVRVPRGARLALCTINGGEIRVEQTAGDFQVNNINGPIAMSGIRGAGSAETVNGSVTVAFSEAPRAALFVKTLNGDVDVILPASLSADLQLKTFNGDLLTDFDVQPLPQPAPAAVERRGMKNVYRSNDFARVRVGRGGPELTFETFNGDVRVRTSR